mmetsp:Transcript_8303/g.20396  ORF Transcript_8303/g.20396 Transcript_8303/m.20396 type:complete len:212 (+) Transcript_8303:101-736(+)
MTFKSSLLISIILLSALSVPSSGFVARVSPATRRTRASDAGATTLSATATTQSSRRNFLATTTILSTTTAALTTPLPAYAKKESEPITRETVTAAFDAIRFELTSDTGVVSTLANLIQSGDRNDEIVQFTRESDAYFRKAKIGAARKLLTDKELKGDAIGMSNAVTWDLIGINRASRPGKEDGEEQRRYLEELRKDIERVLELEGTIEVAE